MFHECLSRIIIGGGVFGRSCSISSSDSVRSTGIGVAAFGLGVVPPVACFFTAGVCLVGLVFEGDTRPFRFLVLRRTSLNSASDPSVEDVHMLSSSAVGLGGGASAFFAKKAASGAGIVGAEGALIGAAAVAECGARVVFGAAVGSDANGTRVAGGAGALGARDGTTVGTDALLVAGEVSGAGLSRFPVSAYGATTAYASGNCSRNIFSMQGSMLDPCRIVLSFLSL